MAPGEPGSFGHASTVEQGPRIEHHEVGILLRGPRWQRPEPAPQGRELARLEGDPALEGDEPRRLVRVAAGDRVPDGVAPHPRCFQTSSRHAVEVRALRWWDACPEIVGEQAMEPVPPPLCVHGTDEQVRPLGSIDQLTGIGAPGERLGQRGVERVDDREAGKEVAEVRIQAGHDFIGEVVDHEPLVAGERLHGHGGVGGRAQGDRRELESRGPSLRPAHEVLDDDGLRVKISVREEGGRLVGGEAEVLGTELDERPVRAQPPDRQSGVLPGDEHEVAERWHPFDERPHEGVGVR